MRPSDGLVVQYFEAAVLEYDENRGNPGLDELSRKARAMRLIRPLDLGHAYTSGRTFPKAETTPDGARRFSETGYTLHGEFREFYEGLPGEWRLGAPLSEELVEEINGVPTKVQYFQKGRLEKNPQTGAIQLGLLGRWAFQMNCH